MDCENMQSTNQLGWCINAVEFNYANCHDPLSCVTWRYHLPDCRVFLSRNSPDKEVMCDAVDGEECGRGVAPVQYHVESMERFFLQSVQRVTVMFQTFEQLMGFVETC